MTEQVETTAQERTPMVNHIAKSDHDTWCGDGESAAMYCSTDPELASCPECVREYGNGRAMSDHSTGARIREARRPTGVTQASLAELMKAQGFVNWRAQTLVKVERSQRRLTLEEGAALASLLGVSMEWLATGKGELEQSGGAIDHLTDEVHELKSKLSGATRALRQIALMARVVD